MKNKPTHILVMHPDTWKALVGDFEPCAPIEIDEFNSLNATIFSLPINRAECVTMGSDDLLTGIEDQSMTDYDSTASLIIDIADMWGDAGIGDIQVSKSRVLDDGWFLGVTETSIEEFSVGRADAIKLLAAMLKDRSPSLDRTIPINHPPVAAISPLTIKQSIPAHRQRMIDGTVEYFNKYLTGMVQQGKGIEKPITIYVSYDDQSDLAGAWASVHKEVVDRFKEAGWVIARIEDVRLHYGSVIAYEFRFPDDLIYKDAE